MSKHFQIELNQPQFVLPRGKSHDFLSIFSTCFSFPDALSLYWNGHEIVFLYEYNVSQLIYPVLEMLQAITSSGKGKYRSIFGMDSLQTDWCLTWDNNNLNIKSHWFVVFSTSLTEKLNNDNKLNISTAEFIKEWQKLIILLESIIDESGIEIQSIGYDYKFLQEIIELVDDTIIELEKN